MGTTDNNLRVPDELREQAAELAERQGRTADDLVTDALKRYIATRELGRTVALWPGPCESTGLAFVERVIREDRFLHRKP